MEIPKDLLVDRCLSAWIRSICMTRYTAEQIADMLKAAGFFDISINKKENLFLVMGYKR